MNSTAARFAPCCQSLRDAALLTDFYPAEKSETNQYFTRSLELPPALFWLFARAKIANKTHFSGRDMARPIDSAQANLYLATKEAQIR